MKLVNSVFSWYIKQHCSKVDRYLEYPEEVQNIWFKKLILQATNTEWGKKHHYHKIKGLRAFKQQVPISTYEDLKPYFHKMMMGAPDILWPGTVKWFSKSSGTTNDKSKFIPVTDDNLKECHLRGAYDVMSKWYELQDSRIFEGKNLVMGGSHQPFAENPNVLIGDVSAIMVEHMPAYARFFHTPDIETTLLPDYEEKLEKMMVIASNENVTTTIGVPTWTLVLLRKILDYTGKSNMLEVWPNFEVYMHGGVNFEPYREQFRTLFPSDHVGYLNVYNASEGFFAAQLEKEAPENEMSLMLDNGVFYEFLPLSEMGKDGPDTCSLKEVEIGKQYAIVISTNSGLWRYLPGDTVTFTSVYPFKVQITGRTQQFINVFGEEVTVANTDKALVAACKQFNCQVKDYTVAPIHLTNTSKGGHEWLIEFKEPPNNSDAFAAFLDQQLQSLNSDYEAKRFKDIALQSLRLKVLQEDTFYQWLKSKGKIGGQYKVPRLANDRKYVDEINRILVHK